MPYTVHHIWVLYLEDSLLTTLLFVYDNQLRIGQGPVHVTVGGLLHKSVLQFPCGNFP